MDLGGITPPCFGEIDLVVVRDRSGGRSALTSFRTVGTSRPRRFDGARSNGLAAVAGAAAWAITTASAHGLSSPLKVSAGAGGHLLRHQPQVSSTLKSLQGQGIA